MKIRPLFALGSSTLLAAFGLSLPTNSSAAVLPVSGATYSGSYTPGTPPNITGDATITGLTTTEGTFTGLFGATANNVTSQQVANSLGTAPASLSAAVTGLSINDGVNNLNMGNFQLSLSNGVNANTRFFIVESTLVSGTIGDPLTVTLINANNVQVGTYTLGITAAQFTNSAAGNTSNAICTLQYTSGVANNTANQSKLGGVTFSLADFTGTGDLSTVTGIAINGNNSLDPNVVGTFSTAVPEPGTWGILAAGTALLAFAFRRKAGSF